MIQENLFEKALLRVNFYLKVIGLGIDRQDSNRSFIERIRNRLFYMINILWLSYSCVGQLIWFINGVVYGTSTIIENTHLLPCLTLCCLGIVKSYFIVKYGYHVNELIQCLTNMQLIVEMSVLKETLTMKWTTFLMISNKILVFINISGVLTFVIGPIIKTAVTYYRSGEIVLNVPFFVWYPFDAYNISYWPIAYIDQLWSAFVATTTVFGPDCLYYTSCTFIHIQFSYLKYDIKSIIARNSNRRVNVSNEIFYMDLGNLVNRHRELMRCINLLEIIYSKSTLFNVLTSSLVICVTGFNILAIEDLAMATPFIFFLGLGLFQIYLFCYYGNTITQSSMEVSGAVYDSNWYEYNSSEMKDCLFIMIRAQRPCKLTAYGFSEVNLKSFSRILSTAWSYFALLVTMYDNK